MIKSLGYAAQIACLLIGGSVVEQHAYAAVKSLSAVIVKCPLTINESSTDSCSATAKYSDGSSTEVTSGSTWTPLQPLLATISAGSVTTKAVTSDQSLSISASFAYLGKKMTGSTTLTVKDIPSAPRVEAPTTGQQYGDLIFAFTWSAGTQPAGGVSLVMTGSEVRSRTSTTSVARFTARSSEVGSRAWKLVSQASGTVLASGQMTISSAPDFPYTEISITWPGNYCEPQCVTFIKKNLGITKKGNAESYFGTPPSGYLAYAQGSTRPPRPGDILVWQADVNPRNQGHVALVKSVDLASGSLTMVDTNWPDKCVFGSSTMTLTGTGTPKTWTLSSPYPKRSISKLRGWVSKDADWPS